MGLTIAQKIIRAHLLEGEMTPGSEIALRIDQTLTQDATGTMAYLEFETMGVDRVRTERSVAYIDHNTLQCGFENADDHRYIQSVAKKHGVWFSRPGNGICHQVHLERFGVPGKTLIGSDSHTPTGGGLGMLAFGAGGMDVAVAMGGGAYHIAMPKLFKVNLTGQLSPYVTAKDVSLEILRILSVKGGVGAIIEWGGAGVSTLSVPERATITNMGAELGATTSIFPSDEVTRAFLEAQGRGADYVPLSSDPDAQYDKIIDIDLSALEPLIACPHSPDNVVPVREIAGTKVDQVCIGSCTNSSLLDMLKVAAILKGRQISPEVSLSISPGSKQVLRMLSECGALSDILQSGARVLECACGPCIGMGFSPNSAGVSLRTFNRNFEGRSGTADARVHLVSPETAAASALMGVITDPRTLGGALNVSLPERFTLDDSAVLAPASPEEAAAVEVVRGPNIKPFPACRPVEDELRAQLTLKVGDNITTDHIMPAGA
ncbi:MAG: aconitate hydratase, partial [Clostridia bacterium]|nr:aconitate hydratase [Clostridia bacterium]